MISSIDFQKNVFSVWNNTVCHYSKDKLIYNLFEESAERFPNNKAVRTSTISITYAQLKEKVDQLANKLIADGYLGNQHIGVYLDRSIDTITAMLAILKVGCAYVPFNTDDPKERVETISKQANLSTIITKLEFEDKVRGSLPLFILASIESSAREDFHIKDPDREKFSSEVPAYIIFTSGTTGVPKGVLVNHRSVINLIEWVNNTFQVNENDSLLWTTNLSFDLSVYDIFGMLAAGGTIRVLSEEEKSDPTKQANILIDEKITFWDSAPQALQRLIPCLDDLSGNNISQHLRLIFASGDWVPLKLPGDLSRFFPHAKFVALGGATEATIWSNYFVVNGIDVEWMSIPYGKPIQNCRYYILDENYGHCLPGKEGSLYIAGECLAVGYYGDPDLTKKKFLSDPFFEGERMYQTGDIARWMADGNIEFLGRTDDQVKIRGYRIELEEIRFKAKDIKGVKELYLFADKTDIQNPQLVMAYRCHEKVIEKQELRSILLEKLPEYMVPSRLIKVDEFPLTSNGKIDKAELLLNGYQTSSSSEIIETKNPIEHELLLIWENVLVTKVGSVNDDFFEIGGNSLLALSLIDAMEKKFSIKIPYHEFIAKKVTIKNQAICIDNKLFSQQEAIQGTIPRKMLEHLYCLQPNGAGIPLFMVYGEKSLLFDDNHFGTSNPVYAFVWPGSDGEKILANSVEQLAHEYLQQVKTVQPSGPYFLSGFSLGALVAFEMACQLKKQGEEVPVLAMMDAIHPEFKVNRIDKWKSRAKGRGLVMLILTNVFESIVKRNYFKFVVHLSEIFGFKLSLKSRKKRIVNKSLKLYWRYRPEKYDGTVLLFRVHNNFVKDPNLGWVSFAKKIISIELEGNHLDVHDLRKNREIVSKELRKSINTYI